MNVSDRSDEFRERVRANWTDDETVRAWRRWHPLITEQLNAVTEALMKAARVASGMDVLDIASGSGEPALRIAQAVLPDGRVTATDLSDTMLDVAREYARAAKATNVSFVAADAERLPFDDDVFDAATCRMGVMFVVDLNRALSEIRRVLRDGSYAAFAVWGAFERSTFFSAPLAPFMKRAEVPQPPPGAPHPLRFAAPDALANELRAVGFGDVREERRVLAMPFRGTPEECWQMYYEMAAPPYVDELEKSERDAALAEALHNLRALTHGAHVNVSAEVVFVSGRA